MAGVQEKLGSQLLQLQERQQSARDRRTNVSATSDNVPIDADAFEQEIIERERLLQSVLEDMSAFVSPPAVYLKINSMLASGFDSASDFAQVILRDPNLTARLLKIVNSPYYGLPSAVDTVSRAITIVGMRDLTDLICSVCAVKSFSRISPDVTNMKAFWQQSVYSAIACKLLAKRLNDPDPEKLFIAGLLHNIGTLVINHRFPELAEKSLIEAAGNETVLAATEQRWLGFDHATLGATILTQWGLPESLCDAIRYHHDAPSAKHATREAAIIQIADGLATRAGFGGFPNIVGEFNELTKDALKLSGLVDDFSHTDLTAEIREQFGEVERVLAV